jgi:hypothetical protein
MEEKKIAKFEFLMSLEDNIICQRYFNVRGYRPENRRCYDLYESLKWIEYVIEDDLKMKSMNYLMEQYNRYTNHVNLSEQDQNIEKDTMFHMYLKLNGEVVNHKIFPAWIYPSRIRYTVDIRPFVSKFLKQLSDVLSAKKVQKKYLETTL